MGAHRGLFSLYMDLSFVPWVYQRCLAPIGEIPGLKLEVVNCSFYLIGIVR